MVTLTDFEIVRGDPGFKLLIKDTDIDITKTVDKDKVDDSLNKVLQTE